MSLLPQKENRELKERFEIIKEILKGITSHQWLANKQEANDNIKIQNLKI